jgi:hypothetical protein
MVNTLFGDLFYIDEYPIPKRIGPIDVQLSREKSLKSTKNEGSDSKYSLEFRHQIDGLVYYSSNDKPFYYIREFPIPIINKERWVRILKDFGLTIAEYVDRNFFKLDYFFKYTGIAVEIDSELHNNMYDKARDEYLRITYGLETIRIFRFPKDSDMERFKKRSLEIFNNKTVKEHIFLLTERRAIEEAFNIINRLIEMNYPNFYKLKEIELDKKDFYKKFYKLCPILEFFEVFLQDFEKTFVEIYNKTIKWV